MKCVPVVPASRGPMPIRVLVLAAAMVSSAAIGVGCNRYGRTPVQFTLTTSAQQRAEGDPERIRELAAEAYLVEWTVWNRSPLGGDAKELRRLQAMGSRDDGQAEAIRTALLRELRSRDAWEGRSAYLGSTPVLVTGAPGKEYVFVAFRDGDISYLRFGGITENGNVVAVAVD